jgi:hypothetical protein
LSDDSDFIFAALFEFPAGSARAWIVPANLRNVPAAQLFGYLSWQVSRVDLHKVWILPQRFFQFRIVRKSLYDSCPGIH